MKWNFWKRRWVSVAAAILLLAGAGYCLYRSGIFYRPPELEAEVSRPSPSRQEENRGTLPGTEKPPDDSSSDVLPSDRLFITVERQKYENGDLRLVIPKLSVDASVWGEGTSWEDLSHGACLFEVSQLPGEGDRNVSIVAHRNGLRNNQPTDDALFYYLDTLGEGDYLYLSDSEHIYRYVFEKTTVVEDTDWGPIYSQGYSCLTLVTCTPVGVATHRLVVQGRLDEILPYSLDFDYSASREIRSSQAMPSEELIQEESNV